MIDQSGFTPCKGIKTVPSRGFQILDSSRCQWNLDSRTVILDCQGQLMKIALMQSRCYISFIIIIIIIIIIVQDYTHYDDHIPPAYGQLLFCNTVSSRQK